MRAYYFYCTVSGPGRKEVKIRAKNHEEFYEALLTWLKDHNAALCPGSIVYEEREVIPDPPAVAYSGSAEIPEAIERVADAILHPKPQRSFRIPL